MTEKKRSVARKLGRPRKNEIRTSEKLKSSTIYWKSSRLDFIDNTYPGGRQQFCDDYAEQYYRTITGKSNALKEKIEENEKNLEIDKIIYEKLAEIEKDKEMLDKKAEKNLALAATNFGSFIDLHEDRLNIYRVKIFEQMSGIPADKILEFGLSLKGKRNQEAINQFFFS